MTNHNCKDLKAAKASIFFYEGRWWMVTNADTEIPIAYCPFCGQKLEPVAP